MTAHKVKPVPPPVDRAAGTRAAVAARKARAEVKKSLQTSAVSPFEVLERSKVPNTPEATLRVPDFLESMPWMGPVRAARVMEQLKIAQGKRLGGLGVLQRERLVRWLRERAERLGGGPHLVVLAGPTAAGKGTVSKWIRDHRPDVLLSTSVTTRPPRPGETDGVEYFFVDDAEFDRLIETDALLEWAVVHNSHRYGTPKQPVLDALDAGRSVLLEIDLQGARQVRRSMPTARLLFLMPPSWDELVRRLVSRGTESSDEQQRRLETAKIELAARDEFDHIVVNDDVARAADEVVALMQTSGTARHSS